MSVRCAVMVPCHNEEVTIEKVIHDVRAYLPEAGIYVLTTILRTVPHNMPIMRAPW